MAAGVRQSFPPRLTVGHNATAADEGRRCDERKIPVRVTEKTINPARLPRRQIGFPTASDSVAMSDTIENIYGKVASDLIGGHKPSKRPLFFKEGTVGTVLILSFFCSSAQPPQSDFSSSR